MAPEDAIRAGIHGEAVGAAFGVIDPLLGCDYTHPGDPHSVLVIADRMIAPIDYGSPVLYECIRVVDVPLLKEHGAPDEWMVDAVRCEACAIDAIADPTNGYEEALIAVGINASGGVLTVDATDFELLDYSPATEGLDPLRLPPALLPEMIAEEDFGGLRRSRAAIYPQMLRANGMTELAEHIEVQL